MAVLYSSLFSLTFLHELHADIFMLSTSTSQPPVIALMNSLKELVESSTAPLHTTDGATRC